MSGQIDLTASGICLASTTTAQYTAEQNLVILSETVVDIAGSGGVTINGTGDPGIVSILSFGDFVVRANQPTSNPGTLEHTEADGWKIDGVKLADYIKSVIADDLLD
jgi:hypothetical protein